MGEKADHGTMRSLYLLFASSLLISGCASIFTTVEFEVLEPATVSFPDEVAQILVLNHAPFTLDVVNEKNREGLTLEQMVMVDTAICNSTFRGLQAVLRQSPLERFHMPFWFSERRGDTALLQDMFLTKREVAAYCEEYASDAIISLEMYTLGMDDSVVYYEDAPGEIASRYYPVYNKLVWNIYLPGYPRVFDSYSMKDTLYFIRVADGVIQPVPSGIDMIRELFYTSGMNYGRYLVPVWTRTSRALYRGKGDSLKLASKYTARGEWESAYAIWEGLSASGDSTVASKALYNMAIYHELEDKLDSASILVHLALEMDSLEAIQDYQEELETRILNRNEILKQIN